MRKFCVSAICAVAISAPIWALAKPKMSVQYVAETTTGGHGTFEITAWLILPDGSHAKASCWYLAGGAPCTVEPARLEKRVLYDCPEIAAAKCFKDEWYYADRKGNDIIIHPPTGSATFHIKGSW